MAVATDRDPDLEAIRTRMIARFGLVPSFFMMARAEPPIVNAMFGMAEFAYFDSPIPALFKERLFTYVSRFCRVPYCMARHCGFLLGRGNVSGQPGAAGASVDHVVAMLRAPFPALDARQQLLDTLRELPGPIAAWPEPETDLEDTLFFAAAVAFVMPLEHRPILRELERLLGPQQYNYLMLFLAFIRFAHYWTETHCELQIEDDLDELFAEQSALAEWMSRYNEIVRTELGQQVQEELRELEMLRARAALLEAGAALLREEVAERTQAAAAAGLAKVGFMATVSHELRTPLNAILGYADLLDSGVAGPLGDRVADYIARIKVSARHQQQLIEEILAFSRLDAGQDLADVEPVTLSEIRDEVDAIISPLAEMRGLAFTTDFAGAPAIVNTDPRKLRRVLLNLLGNAVKFTLAGQVTLIVQQQDNAVTFTIIDSGPGIQPKDRQRIFEPFTQVDGSLTRAHGGTGLGLAITRRLVELLGGTISVESLEGDGSTFTVALPVQPSTADNGSAAGATDGTGGRQAASSLFASGA